MVNALARTKLDTTVANETRNFVLNDSDKAANEKNLCALREFINSNADLPTIEELAKGSKSLAMAMGMFD